MKLFSTAGLLAGAMAMSLLGGCSGSSDNADGGAATNSTSGSTGRSTNGGSTNGGSTNGNSTNGNSTNGGSTNGGSTIGGSTNGSASIGGSTGGSGGNDFAGLGAACASDADCGGTTLTCVLPSATSTIFGGGPANGYCSTTCTVDADCGATGLCLQDSTGAGTCVLTCGQGPALAHINDPISDPSKCLARTDVACAGIGSGEFVCIPQCGDDSQCPSGLHCDEQSGTCLATVNPGQADGTACDATATTDPCAGACLGLELADGGTVNVCSRTCELGVDPNNGTPTSWTACGGLQSGLCIYSDQGSGAGDQGFCTNACSKQDDCDNPNFFCFAITNLTGSGGITNGWCFPNTACPNGQSDCAAAGTTTTCTPTAFGPQCLSTQFPLGSAAPDAGATPDAGP